MPNLPTQKDVFVPGGAIFRNPDTVVRERHTDNRAGLRQLDRGRCLPAGDERSRRDDREAVQVFAGTASGQGGDRRGVGRRVARRRRHARARLGLADHFARDEQDAIRTGRRIVTRLNWRKAGTPATGTPRPPRYAADDLLAIVPPDLKSPFDPREIRPHRRRQRLLTRMKPLYGQLAGHRLGPALRLPIGILANARGVLFSEESQKATQFIQLANRSNTPLLFLHNTTGYMVGKNTSKRGIIKHGAMMINAVANSTVPHLSLLVGNPMAPGTMGCVVAPSIPGSSSPGPAPGRR